MSPDPTKSPRLLLVTGLAGAGRSSALKGLEDIGYDAIDNLPLPLMPSLVAGFGETSPATGAGGLALGLDSRSRGFTPPQLLEALRALRAERGWRVDLIFMDCDDDVLYRRFTETRRRHPLLPDRSVRDGIAAERHLMAPVKAAADLVVDTSQLSPGALKTLLGGHFALAKSLPMAISLVSFSYRAGLPREADLVFDVRFLANPHYDPVLRPLSGEDDRVAAAIAADPAYGEFFHRLTAWLQPLLPFYEREGKSYLTIAIGCTGGRHRSVFVARQLAAWLREAGHRVHVTHRDLDRAGSGETRGA